MPKVVRKQALACLRHYPADFYIDMAAKKLPDVFKKLEPEEDWLDLQLRKREEKRKRKKDK